MERERDSERERVCKLLREAEIQGDRERVCGRQGVYERYIIIKYV